MPKVLIVDDDAGVLETFARMLRLEGYDVLTVLDADTAVREMEVFRPDAMFVDLRLPVTCGLTFIRQLRARESPRVTPVAVMTADYAVDDATRDELKDLHADLYLKPLWLEDLVRIAAGLIARRQ
jgi:two-component system response regulator PrrA